MTTILNHPKTWQTSVLAVLAVMLLWCAHSTSRPGFAQGGVPKSVQSIQPEVASPTETDALLSYFIPFSVFVCMLLAVLWVVRTILENRRWNKSFKVHEDVHTKLIDKFASGQELTAYMESDAGR